MSTTNGRTPDSVVRPDTSSEVQERLADQGFSHGFHLAEGAVVHDETGARHPPQHVAIRHTHRHEGDTDPGDESVLFALEAPDGTKGVLAANYGPDAPHAEEIRLLGTQAA